MSRAVITKEELAENIDKELSWRKKELEVFKLTIPTDNSSKQKVLLRCAIPIIYAHWEGFVKKSCELYLEYVSSKNEVLKELKPQFIALALRQSIQVQQINKIEERTKAVEFIINNLDLSANVPTKNIIKTKSNLKFEVFKDICQILCIDIEPFSKKDAVIDDLVNTRNTIAHGNYQNISYKMFCDFYNDTVTLLETLRTELENATALDNHKRNSICSSTK